MNFMLKPPPQTDHPLPPGEAPDVNTALGRREWDDRMGHLVNQATMNRIIVIACLGITGLAVVGYFAKDEHYAPPNTIVRDTAGDIIAKIGPDAGPPNDVIVASTLKHWIVDARSIYTDPAVLRDSIVRAFGRLKADSQAVGLLNSFFKQPPNDSNPAERATKETVSIDRITGVPLDDASMHGPRSFRLQWQEHIIRADGTPTSDSDWWCVITYEWRPPASKDEEDRAPEGIWITSFRWTAST